MPFSSLLLLWIEFYYHVLCWTQKPQVPFCLCEGACLYVYIAYSSPRTCTNTPASVSQVLKGASGKNHLSIHLVARFFGLEVLFLFFFFNGIKILTITTFKSTTQHIFICPPEKCSLSPKIKSRLVLHIFRRDKFKSNISPHSK